MSAEFFCIGLSHKTAPVGVREKLAVPDEQQVEVLKRLESTGEVMVVSTCNRMELFGASADERAREAVLEAIASLGGAEAVRHVYEHHGDAALVHLFRVAASLDSMVVGEPQILGQVKEAFELAHKTGTVKGELIRACQAAFSSAKRVRAETGVGRAATSMASAAVELAAKVFGQLAQRPVLLVGAGEMSELVARHLLTAGATQIAITNRTQAHAQQLAELVGATTRPWESLAEHLVWADLVVCSVATPQPLFTRAGVGTALKGRKHRPLFMVDLAVPRAVEPTVAQLSNVYSYDVDDIQRVVAENAAARAAEAAKAEVIVTEEVARFLRARAVREGVPVLAQLRQRAEQIVRSEVEKTLTHMGDELSDKQKKSIEAMAHAIVNKLLHQPTAKLRALSTEDDKALAGAAAELFGLPLGETAGEEH